MKLNIGCGVTRIKGFMGVDGKKLPSVDYVCEIDKLKFAKDNTVDELYASHCLEHFPHAETERVLKEWHRVLKPKGKILISVPDMVVMCKVCLEFGFVDWVEKMMFGGQYDKTDLHLAGFDTGKLMNMLSKVGFLNISRVDSLGKIKNDCSCKSFMNKYPVSINMIAYKNGGIDE